MHPHITAMMNRLRVMPGRYAAGHQQGNGDHRTEQETRDTHRRSLHHHMFINKAGVYGDCEAIRPAILRSSTSAPVRTSGIATFFRQTYPRETGIGGHDPVRMDWGQRQDHVLFASDYPFAAEDTMTATFSGCLDRSPSSPDDAGFMQS